MCFFYFKTKNRITYMYFDKINETVEILQVGIFFFIIQGGKDEYQEMEVFI